MSFSEISVMAPVWYIPAATISRAPIVSIPGFENPFKLSFKGARRKVIVNVNAPTKMATGGILLLIKRANVNARMAIVIYWSTGIQYPPILTFPTIVIASEIG
jgi:hypothetical protein